MTSKSQPAEEEPPVAFKTERMTAVKYRLDYEPKEITLILAADPPPRHFCPVVDLPEEVVQRLAAARAQLEAVEKEISILLKPQQGYIFQQQKEWQEQQEKAREAEWKAAEEVRVARVRSLSFGDDGTEDGRPSPKKEKP